MFIQLPVFWLVVTDILAWLAIHLGMAWLGTRLPGTFFLPNSWLFRPHAWEGKGKIYATLFRIKTWKKWLPDGAVLFAGGFPKAQLRNRDTDYIDLFIRETCRGEAVHWAVMLAAPVFFLWNPAYVGMIMMVYAVLANLPCILTQRYNRIRLGRLARRL